MNPDQPDRSSNAVVFRFEQGVGRSKYLNQKSFTKFFHFGKCEILLKSKILLKLHLLKSKNYCNQSPAPSSHSSIQSLNNSLRQISPQMDAQVTGSFDEFLRQNPNFLKFDELIEYISTLNLHSVSVCVKRLIRNASVIFRIDCEIFFSEN